MFKSRRNQRVGRSAALQIVLITIVSVACGCQSGPFKSLKQAYQDPSAQKSHAPDALLSRWIGKTPVDPAITKAGGLTLGPDGWVDQDPAHTDVLLSEFEAAETLYLKGELNEAERAFGRIARKERSPEIRLFKEEQLLGSSNQGGSPWRMKALYYLGEIRFRTGRYVQAHRTFEQLINEFPGTPHLDEAVAREFQIAQIWLNQVAPNEDQPPLPWQARFTGGLPILDTGGSAVEVLNDVRMNSYDGPLADDAVKLIADHYERFGNYEQAAYYYDQMADEYPKSPLLHEAIVSGVDAKLNAYLGPHYDFSQLEEARESAQRALRLFPERQASTGDSLYHKMDLIEDQAAERDYEQGLHYQSSGYATSAEFLYSGIIAKWPKSEWADKAKLRLVEVARMPRRKAAPSTIWNLSEGGNPYSQGISSNNAGFIGPGGAAGP